MFIIEDLEEYDRIDQFSTAFGIISLRRISNRRLNVGFVGPWSLSVGYAGD